MTFTPSVGGIRHAHERIAATQHWIVASWQMHLSRKAIEHGLRSGRLHLVHKGVYAVGHPPETAQAREMGAVLACGPSAVLSHWSAAARWGLLRPVSGCVHVTAPIQRRARSGICVHRVKELNRRDWMRREGIPITTVPRTLLDLAALANDRALKRAINQADRLGWLNRRATSELLDRNRGRRGTKRLAAFIDAVHPLTHRTRSDLEADFLKLLKKHKIPTPLANEELHGYEVDFYWPEAKLIVELDFYEYHRTPAEFANDRRRDAKLKKLGYEVIRIPDEWLNSAPHEVAAHIEHFRASRIRA